MSLQLVLNVPQILLTILGIFFNIYLVTAVVLTKQISSANILLLHLGVINTILGLFSLIFTSIVLNDEGWPCILYGFFHTLIHSLILWTICGLNCDRYYAIAAPLHYGYIVNRKKVFIGIGIAWIVSLIFCLPPFFNKNIGKTCGVDFPFSNLWYSTLYTAFTFLLPATVIICCNIKILMIARYHRHRIASAIYEVTLSAQVTITHQRNPFFVPSITSAAEGPKFRGRNAVNTVILMVGSLLILYLPYYILIIWKAFSIHFVNIIKIHQNCLTIVSVLLLCSPLVNGFLYGVKNKVIRKSFQNYWRKKQSKSEVNQEIQARTPSTCGSRRPSLTPLGFTTSTLTYGGGSSGVGGGVVTKPLLQRRLSETLFDQKDLLTSKIKRASTELSWHPSSSTTNLNLSSKDDLIMTTANPSPSTSATTAKLMNRKILYSSCISSSNSSNSNRKSSTEPNKRSPRIMITRAYSEENDSKSKPNSPSSSLSGDSIKRHSTSTILLEKKWRQLNDLKMKSYQQHDTTTTTTTTTNIDFSDSTSETSDTSSGKIFINLDNKTILSQDDDQLLNWTPKKKSSSNPIKRTTILE